VIQADQTGGAGHGAFARGACKPDHAGVQPFLSRMRR
jgi:hypothetical protein